MKILLHLFLISTLTLGYANLFQAQVAQIVIKGEVLNTTSKVKDYTINVYENGKMTNSMEMTKNTFNYAIPKNSEVMLEFIANGHYAKRIAFDTKLDEELKKVPRLDLRMNLVEKSENDNCAGIRDLLDLPTAFITYSAKREYYDKNLEYSKIIKKEIENQLASR